MSGRRIALVASARFPIAEPFAGGLEAQVWALADGLRRRGHAVTLFAGPGSDALPGVEAFDLRRPQVSDSARADVSMSAPRWLEEHHAYLDLMLRLSNGRAGTFDVVHNHSLHHLPIAMAATLPMPLLTTLHTPPTPWLESAIEIAGGDAGEFAAVSAQTARAWRHLLPDARVVHNGVDASRWKAGPGGGPAVWFGRIAPEKGTHLAIEAAVRADLPLLIAGPIADRDYHAAEVRPRLHAAPRVSYVGHLDHDALAQLVGAASTVLVTPRWDEPYGLVVAEALACGTPVCAFARGGLPEVLGEGCGLLVAPDDVAALARAMSDAPLLSRATARRHAVEHCSLEHTIARYERVYDELATRAEPLAAA
ncbi:glycosyltransferase family 4 protein [Conexibacter sp. JD483]|uniref:glycosyltransferase family 4 protein n=1 Tax=unclassified Conexibacter TaxID=2627773 RepID=UPI002724CCC3|nr:MULTISPECIES: glycosyltransferase family 4 protein [unclassified Conexibacter]MDO8188523.1 glycosyltransferase family 4 protein [Conexibacter sp. CPCC 205706]MDO8200133.1 glycosyltransferase family 4 protein [Conexibacter sp. CPCC 205762]MDR9371172.1 glycosyltransferase family 4 protein [Conexibacter sp. JD483]